VSLGFGMTIGIWVGYRYHEGTKIRRRRVIIEQLKDKLRTLMRKPPLYVVNGSYQTAVKYKEDFMKAQKVLNKTNPKEQELRQCIYLMEEK